MKKQTAIEIVPASYNDMKDVAKIISSSSKWYEPFVEQKDMSEHTPGQEWIDKNFQKRDFYVGKNDEGVNVGTISMQHFDTHTYLGYIYLDIKHVGKGIGKKLIEFAKRVSTKKGQESMILIAHPKAKWAVKAYEKFGFRKKFENKKDVISYKNGLLKNYYEEGFHLYEYSL